MATMGKTTFQKTVVDRLNVLWKPRHPVGTPEYKALCEAYYRVLGRFPETALMAALDRLERTHGFQAWPQPEEIRSIITEGRSNAGNSGDYVKHLAAKQRRIMDEAMAQAMRPYEQRYAGDRSMLFEVRSVIRQNIGGVVQARMAGDPEPALPRLTDAELEECRWRADRFAESPETADEVEDAA